MQLPLIEPQGCGHPALNFDRLSPGLREITTPVSCPECERVYGFTVEGPLPAGLTGILSSDGTSPEESPRRLPRVPAKGRSEQGSKRAENGPKSDRSRRPLASRPNSATPLGLSPTNPPRSTRVRKICERERALDIDPTDQASLWLTEHESTDE